MFESYIDTKTFSTYDIRGAGPHTVLSMELNEPVVGFGMQGVFKIPALDVVGKGVHQLGFITYLQNKTNLNLSPIGFVNLISESRPELNDFAPYVGHDTYTFFFSQPIKSNMFATRITPNVNSHESFTDEKSFGFVFTLENIQVVLKKMQEEIDKGKAVNPNLQDIDQNPHNYNVILAGVLHETFIFNDPVNQTKSGYSVRNLELFKMK